LTVAGEGIPGEALPGAQRHGGSQDAIKALTETVEAGSKNMEVCSMTSVPLPSSNSFFRAFLPAEMAFVCSYDSSAAKPTLLANVYLVICPAGKIYSCASQRLLLALSLSKLPVL